MCCCGQKTVEHKCDLQEVYCKWSVPISPAAVIVPRFTVSVREWLLPMAVRFWLVAVQRAARFCPPDPGEEEQDIALCETGAISGAREHSPRFPFFIGGNCFLDVIAVFYFISVSSRGSLDPWRSPGTMWQIGRYSQEIATSPLRGSSQWYTRVIKCSQIFYSKW